MQGSQGILDILVLEALGVLQEDLVIDFLDGSFQQPQGPSHRPPFP